MDNFIFVDCDVLIRERGVALILLDILSFHAVLLPLLRIFLCLRKITLFFINEERVNEIYN